MERKGEDKLNVVTAFTQYLNRMMDISGMKGLVLDDETVREREEEERREEREGHEVVLRERERERVVEWGRGGRGRT